MIIHRAAREKAGQTLKISIQNQDVTPNETTQILKGLITGPVTKSWNATRFMEENKKAEETPKAVGGGEIDQLRSDSGSTNQLHIKGCSRNTGEGGF